MLVKVPNLPKCPVGYRAQLWNKYRYPRYRGREYTGTQGIFMWVYRTYGSVEYQYWRSTALPEVSSTGIENNPTLSVGYRYQTSTELTEVSGPIIETVPTKYTYPRYSGRGHTGTRSKLSWSYRTYRRVEYRYRVRTEPYRIVR